MSLVVKKNLGESNISGVRLPWKDGARKVSISKDPSQLSHAGSPDLLAAFSKALYS